MTKLKTTHFKTAWSEEFSTEKTLSENIESIINNDHGSPDDSDLVGRINRLDAQVSSMTEMMGILFQKLADKELLELNDIRKLVDPTGYYSSKEASREFVKEVAPL